MNDENNYLIEYYERIESGEENVGRWIRLLYEWLVAGIKTGRWFYNEKKADRAIRFIETFCRHNKGALAPGRLILSLWQKAFLSALYGIVDATGKRQFTEVALFVGRKCGKTLLASAIITYEAYVDGEYGSEIYCIAPKLDQSELVYSAFEFTINKNPDLLKRSRKRKTDWIIDRTNTTIKKIAFSEKKADGYSPVLTVADEMSSWPGARGLRQYEVMTSGTGARQEPITLSISSGGYVNEGIYDELFKRGTGVLLGTSQEIHLLPVFYMIDNPARWDDMHELEKSLPGMGISVPRQFIEDEIRIAKGSLSKRAEFLTKYCCIKQSSTSAWLQAADIEKAYGEPIDLEKFRGHSCMVGIDLSRTTDLTAAVILLEIDGEIYLIAHFWIPSAKIDEAQAADNLPYDAYIQRGFLSLSGDQFIDYHDCYDWIKAVTKQYNLHPLVTGYDKWSATYLVQDMTADGYRMDDVRQGYNLSPILKDFGALLAEGKIHLGDNDLLKAHFYGGALQTERGTERVKLVKFAKEVHIDGLAAAVDAMTVRDKYWSEWQMAITPTSGAPVTTVDAETEAEIEAELDAEFEQAMREINEEYTTTGGTTTYGNA